VAVSQYRNHLTKNLIEKTLPLRSGQLFLRDDDVSMTHKISLSGIRHDNQAVEVCLPANS
jgi:hypothetical protein